MIITNILGNIKEYNAHGKNIEKIYLEWFELEKKRILVKTENGEEIGININEHLKDGDVIYSDDTRIIMIEVKDCDLTIVKVSTMKEMGRACFEVGNRHLSVSIRDDSIAIPYDEPTFLYLQKKNFAVEHIKGKFNDYVVCKAHGESHAHTHHHTENHEA